MDTQSLKPHPVAECFPPLTATEYADLLADIKEHGVRVPIVVADGLIVDGVHRHRAAGETGRPCPTEPLPEGQDAGQAADALNLARRHLDESQRAMTARRRSRKKPGQPKKNSQNFGKTLTQDEAADVYDTNPESIRQAGKVQDREDVPELAAAVDKGKRAGGIAVSDAAKVADEEADTILEALELVDAGEAKTASAAVEQVKKERQVVAPKPAPPDGKYSVIVVDPPWPVEAMIRTEKVPGEGVDVPYATMELEDIARLPVEDLADGDCWVFCWATQRFLA